MCSLTVSKMQHTHTHKKRGTHGWPDSMGARSSSWQYSTSLQATTDAGTI